MDKYREAIERLLLLLANATPERVNMNGQEVVILTAAAYKIMMGILEDALSPHPKKEEDNE